MGFPKLLAVYLAQWDLDDMENLGKSFLFSLCVYMLKRAGSLTEIPPFKGEISLSGMNRNP